MIRTILTWADGFAQIIKAVRAALPGKKTTIQTKKAKGDRVVCKTATG